MRVKLSISREVKRWGFETLIKTFSDCKHRYKPNTFFFFFFLLSVESCNCNLCNRNPSKIFFSFPKTQSTFTFHASLWSFVIFFFFFWHTIPGKLRLQEWSLPRKRSVEYPINFIKFLLFWGKRTNRLGTIRTLVIRRSCYLCPSAEASSEDRFDLHIWQISQKRMSAVRNSLRL